MSIRLRPCLLPLFCAAGSYAIFRQNWGQPKNMGPFPKKMGPALKIEAGPKKSRPVPILRGCEKHKVGAPFLAFRFVSCRELQFARGLAVFRSNTYYFGWFALFVLFLRSKNNVFYRVISSTWLHEKNTNQTTRRQFFRSASNGSVATATALLFPTLHSLEWIAPKQSKEYAFPSDWGLTYTYNTNSARVCVHMVTNTGIIKGKYWRTPGRTSRRR